MTEPTGLPLVLGLPRGHAIRPRKGETLLAAARRADVPLASSCAGRGICGDCVVRVVAGAEALSGEHADETRWRRRRRIDGPLRLACRVTVSADAAVTTTYW